MATKKQYSVYYSTPVLTGMLCSIIVDEGGELFCKVVNEAKSSVAGNFTIVEDNGDRAFVFKMNCDAQTPSNTTLLNRERYCEDVDDEFIQSEMIANRLIKVFNNASMVEVQNSDLSSSSFMETIVWAAKENRYTCITTDDKTITIESKCRGCLFVTVVDAKTGESYEDCVLFTDNIFDAARRLSERITDIIAKIMNQEEVKDNG